VGRGEESEQVFVGAGCGPDVGVGQDELAELLVEGRRGRFNRMLR
jgi:hypothetical protein